ncbi:prenyltransferase [Phycisphaerae bacterium RAS2]|nr:prenyltransferase [Phycisphaerae bacterium RAS2]
MPVRAAAVMRRTPFLVVRRGRTLRLLGLTAALLTAEQAVVRPNDLLRVNLAFFTLNGCVSLLFAAAAITDILLSTRATA